MFRFLKETEAQNVVLYVSILKAWKIETQYDSTVWSKLVLRLQDGVLLVSVSEALHINPQNLFSRRQLRRRAPQTI